MKYATKSIDIPTLLKALRYIATHDNVRRPQLCELTGLSTASIQRLLNTAQQELGVIVKWDRKAWQYNIEQWGLLDKHKVVPK